MTRRVRLLMCGVSLVGLVIAVAPTSDADPIRGGHSTSGFWVKTKAHSARHSFMPQRRANIRSPIAPDRSASSSHLHLLPIQDIYYVDGEKRCASGRAPVVQCAPVAAPVPAAAPARPQVTPGVVRTALERLGLPALQARTQPRDKTLVNFPTIFYAEPTAVTRAVTLLGRPVQIRATARSYTWHYGDGVDVTTDSPGRRYPARDITHEYQRAHVTVLASVDVGYTAAFRVGGGPWQDIPGTVTISGPQTPLRISEATPLLSGEY